jgi:hypothetical protein
MSGREKRAGRDVGPVHEYGVASVHAKFLTLGAFCVRGDLALIAASEHVHHIVMTNCRAVVLTIPLAAVLVACAPASIRPVDQAVPGSGRAAAEDENDDGPATRRGCLLFPCWRNYVKSSKPECPQVCVASGGTNIDPGPPQFTKNGNNGTVSCNTYCAGAGWPGGTGVAASARREDTKQQVSVAEVPGLLPNAKQLTCSCYVPFVKHGNNGTVSCDTYCAGAGWPGGEGGCVNAVRQDTHESLACDAAPGLLPQAAELTCTCDAHAFVKSGNNGSVSCNEYCANRHPDPGCGAWPGLQGSCVSAKRLDDGRSVSCDAPASGPLACSCSSGSPYVERPRLEILRRGETLVSPKRLWSSKGSYFASLDATTGALQLYRGEAAANCGIGPFYQTSGWRGETPAGAGPWRLSIGDKYEMKTWRTIPGGMQVAFSSPEKPGYKPNLSVTIEVVEAATGDFEPGWVVERFEGTADVICSIRPPPALTGCARYGMCNYNDSCTACSAPVEHGGGPSLGTQIGNWAATIVSGGAYSP